MLAFILRRLWQMLPTMAGRRVLVFLLFNWVGGDPAYLWRARCRMRKASPTSATQLGIDQPWYVQLGIFVKQILTFDFGKPGAPASRYRTSSPPGSAPR
jgi:peptide/nickel transport system permease protein